jgi:nucleotide-binding universal stress UspA family protein
MEARTTGGALVERTSPTGSPVVVGIDGSDTSRLALAAAVDLASIGRVPVVAVHAVGLMDRIDGDHVPAFGHQAEIADALDGWCAGFDDCGVRIVRRLEQGAPVDVLLRVAAETAATMIVVGRRGVGGRPDLLLGSTAHQVIERADRAVLVVPPTDRG